MKMKDCLDTVKLFVVIVCAWLSVWDVGFAEDEFCFHCGMSKSEFSYSWVIIEDGDGRRTGVCSIHCAAIDLVINKDTLVRTITVADYKTKEQIDAYKAYWVIGGDQQGVMTLNAKWAFKEKVDADTFIREHGGRLSVFEEVIRTAFIDLYEDTMAIKRSLIMQRTEQNDQRD